MIRLLLVCAFIFSANYALAEKQSFEDWKMQIIDRAAAKGVDPNLAIKVLKPITVNQKVVKLDGNQVHTRLTFQEYLDRVVPQSRLQTAQQRYDENKELLQHVSKKYGVQPQYIVALWGVESDFGRRMGDFSIIRSLSTLAYDGRREKFFTSELLHALKILDQGHITNAKFVGSWAGAMGQCQFMPSSFMAYAQDFNGDGRKDIWGTRADVFASAANYLSKSGWNSRQRWGRQVMGAGDLAHGSKKSLSQWAARGLKNIDGTELPKAQVMATLIRPKRSDKTFLVYQNYRVIKKWNNSDYFALSVAMIADSIRK